MAHEGDIERWSPLRAWFYTNILGRNPRSNTGVVELAKVGPGSRVLDIGCGAGASLEAAVAAGADLVCGVDPSPAMVKRAGQRVPQATVKEGSAEHLDFPDDHFNAVWTISTLHHWADRDAGFKEMFRVLAPGGSFYLAERKLKDGKTGHGITVADAEGVAEHLASSADAETNVVSKKAGGEYLVVIGTI